MMKQMFQKTAAVLALFSTMALSSCDVLLKTAGEVMQYPTSTALTADEVARGLKEALKVGTDSAVVRLSKTNGYYLDNLVKINLPPQTAQVIEYAQKVPGLDKLIADVVVQINRSAEDAVKEAAPIFKSAITQMTIADAFGILNGADTTATHYLRDKTYDQLFSLYQPVMLKSLNKPIVANVSAQKSWNELTSKWNTFANSLPGKLLKVNAINVNLDEYVTQQALSGLFVKVGHEEKKIRTDVNARVTTLLKRVFGTQNK
jgi:hypothetical protein